MFRQIFDSCIDMAHNPEAVWRGQAAGVFVGADSAVGLGGGHGSIGVKVCDGLRIIVFQSCLLKVSKQLAGVARFLPR